jgi:coronin-1B/1C/6
MANYLYSQRNNFFQSALCFDNSNVLLLSFSGIDNAAGILMPFYDNDTQVLFLVGKGDGNIRYYEIVDDNNQIYFLSEYKSSVPAQGAGALPKRCVDVNKNEIFRIYKATATNIEPISFTVRHTNNNTHILQFY